MKQSILKKSSHFFCDGADSSISSANFASIARSTTDTEASSSHVKNVRFLDLIQQAPSSTVLDSPRTETSLNYINFQRFSSNSASSFSSSTNSTSSASVGLNRRPKTSIALKTFNVFNPHESNGSVKSEGDDDPLMAYSTQRASALSFTLKHPTQTTTNQLQHSQHDLLRRTLRISSASLENRTYHHSNRPIDSTPIPLARQQQQITSSSVQTHNTNQDDMTKTSIVDQEDNQHSSQQQQQHQEQELNSPSLLNLSNMYANRIKQQQQQHSQLNDQQQQTTAVNHQQRPIVKPRIGSASSSSTHSTNNPTAATTATTTSTPLATTVYFPSSNQYLNIQSATLTNNTPANRVGSAGAQHRVHSALNYSNVGGVGRTAMTTNLALYTYLLQANKTLAKEMRASVIRSQSKNNYDLLFDNQPLTGGPAASSSNTNGNNNDDNSNGHGNRAIYSIPFPGIKEKKPNAQTNTNNNTNNNNNAQNQYRSSTSLRKRTPALTSKVNYRISSSATLRRNVNLINSKYSNN